MSVAMSFDNDNSGPETLLFLGCITYIRGVLAEIIKTHLTLNSD